MTGLKLTRSSAFTGRANGGAFLSGADVAGLGSQTVFSDSAVDRLTGNGGTDWFLANITNDSTGDSADVIVDASKSEAAGDIDLNQQ